MRKLLPLFAFVLLSVTVPSFPQKLPPPPAPHTPDPPSLCSTIAGNLVTNCGFETGSTAGWTFTAAASGSDFHVFTGSYAHTGTFGAGFGAVGSFDDCISQTLATSPGAFYTLNFWLTNFTTCPGCADFHAYWNGVDIFDASSSAFPYMNLACAEQARGEDTLKFCGRQVPSWYALDDVSVVAGAAGVHPCVTAVAPACPHHRVHGHIDTVPPGGHNGVVAGIHHGQHGHTVTPGAECSPHAPFHSPGLTAETAGEGLFSTGGLAEEPTFVAGLNQDGTMNGNASVAGVPGAKVLPAHRGTVVQLFGSAANFFLDPQDLREANGFTPPVSGSPLFYTTSLPEVRIGGVAAQVLFSGLAPGLTGVWQINVLIPDGVPAGSAPVTINYEGDELTSVSLAIE